MQQLSKRFVSQSLFEDAWLDACEERVMERPSGGSGDSCIVSRLTVVFNQRKFTFIAKRVAGASERHARYDSIKSEIKRLSYKVEGQVLLALREAKFNDVAECLFWLDETRETSVLIEEDLIPKGYPVHFSELNQIQVFRAVDWLVQFHALKFDHPPQGKVWTRGGYWSLDKRTDELKKIRIRWEAGRSESRNNGQGEALDALPQNFAQRLEMSARALDRILFPNFPAPAFDEEEESEMYGAKEEEEDAFQEDAARRERVRKILVPRVEQAMLRFAHSPPPNDSGVSSCCFLRPVLLHGDFKGENIFFARESNHHRAAVCDFQWCGFGLGVLDLVSLLFSSLPPHLNHHAFLNKVVDRYGAGLLPNWTRKDRAILRFLFDFALVDYARYVVGTGLFFPEDAFLLQYANQVLSELDRGNILPADFMYDDALREMQQQILRD